MDSVSGTAKDIYGAVVGDSSTQVEGKAQHAKGEAQKKINSSS